jgi:CheY-like chemotaxis protein
LRNRRIYDELRRVIMAKKILVIDDEELITKSLLKLLNTEGYNATVVRSGKEALNRVKETDFDLIICDVRMPEMDGIETIKEIRTYLEKTNKNPIPEVLITGYADMDKYEMAKDLEVAEYLYKPFNREDFLKVVKKLLGN